MLTAMQTKSLAIAALITVGLHGSILWKMNDMATVGGQAQTSMQAGNRSNAMNFTETAAPAAKDIRHVTLEPVLVLGSHSAYIAEQATARAGAPAPVAQPDCGKAAHTTAAWSAQPSSSSVC